MFKISISSAINNAGNIFTRFYITLFYAVVGACLKVYALEFLADNHSKIYLFNNLYFTSMLGIVLSISITLFSEREKFNFGLKLILQLIGGGVLAYYFVNMPEEWSVIEIKRAFLYIIALHSLVSFAPFIKSGNLNGFWQFNKTIFIHILISVLYTVVLFIGITIAIASINNLFNLKLDSKIYLELFILMLGIFNTWFFLSGVPSNFEELDTQTEYPKGLKIFTQFVLVPLVTTYFVILYMYLGKIIVLWELPNGLVSYLVIGFSFFGILSLLLIYPLQKMESEKWINIYSIWFYKAILPFIALLFLAIGTRISNYGITESRYFILVLACWLASISIYLQINKLQNIKIIPITLFFMAIFTSFGPWGAFEVSKRSQLNRFIIVLEKNNLIKEGKIIKPSKKISLQDQKEIRSLVSYLVVNYGVKSLHNFLPDYLKLNDSLKKNYEARATILNFLQVEEDSYVENSDENNELSAFNYTSDHDLRLVRNVSGYDIFISQSYIPSIVEIKDTIEVGEDKVFSYLSDKSLGFKYKNEYLQLDMLEVYKKISNRIDGKNIKSKNNEPLYVILLNGKTMSIKISVFSLRGHYNKDKNSVVINHLFAETLIKLEK